MRSIPIIAGISLVTYLLAVEAHDFFITNDGVNFFSSSPARLAYVGCIAGAGAGLYVAFTRLPRRIKKYFYLAATGGLGIALTTLAAALAYVLLVDHAMLAESGLRGAILGSFLAVTGFSVCIWIFFYGVMTANRNTGQPFDPHEPCEGRRFPR